MAADEINKSITTERKDLMMNENNDRTSKLSSEEFRFMTDQLVALSENRPDIDDGNCFWNAADEAIAEEIIELARDSDPNWYEVAERIVFLSGIESDEFLWYSSWEEWSEENALATEIIAKYVEIYRQLTELREIPVEKYTHLTPDRIDTLLKPLSPHEPRVPATDYEIECPTSDVWKWREWKEELLSRLKAG